MQLIQTQTNRIFFPALMWLNWMHFPVLKLYWWFSFFVSNLRCSAHTWNDHYPLCLMKTYLKEKPAVSWQRFLTAGEVMRGLRAGVRGETMILDRSSVRTHSEVTTPGINSDTCSRFTEAISRVETHRKNNLRPQTHI